MKKNYFCLCLFVFLLTACTMQPSIHPVQFEVNDSLFVNLPKPAELNQTLNVSQLITAQWGKNKQQKLMVQLQVDQQQVVLAGFSAWGARLLSLTYAGDEIQTSVLSGLANNLPKPEQVLFNVMLSIWPVEAWKKPLAQIGWALIEKGLKRELIDNNGQVIVEITYQKKPYLEGMIIFKHHSLDYIITIETFKDK